MMRKGHALTKKMTVEGFAAAGHVTVAVEGQGINWIDAALAARNLRRRIVLTLPNFAAVPFVVGATELISTLPQRLVARFGNLAHVVAVPPPLPARSVVVHLGWHPSSAASPLHTWLRATIRKVAETI
jgi:DNA-binding transcriptional LysR family regulator